MNLNALSLMASFVAIFIVYNALLVSVQQRITSLAILRSLGSSRLQLASIYLVEAILFSLLGAALGILGGWVVANQMVGYIATTINDLYASVQPGAVTLDWTTAEKGLAIAFGSGLLGALVPLWHASRIAPVSVMRPTDAATSARTTSRITFALGLAFLILTIALPALPSNSPFIGFAMAIGAAVGFALLCPFITRLLCGGLDRLAGWRQSLPIRMAAAGVSRSLGITGIAVGAMMLALAMSIGIQTMVANFRGALDSWMDQRFRYDLFLTPQLALDYKIDAVLEPEVIDWARRQPNVAGIVTVRLHESELRGQSVQVIGTQVATILNDTTLSLKTHLPGPFNPAMQLLISEPLAGKLNLHPGDDLAHDTPAAPLHLQVYAIFYDFRSERGQVMLDADLYARTFHDPTVSTLHVKLRDNAAVDATAADWAKQLGPTHAVAVQSFATLKSTVMNVFDRTFKVTDVLAWLAGGIAFCGLAGALVALALARAREYAILTSLGLSRPQTALWLLAEGLLIALTAALVAIIAGTLLAWILASVIQYRSFGWSIPTALRPQLLALHRRPRRRRRPPCLHLPVPYAPKIAPRPRPAPGVTMKIRPLTLLLLMLPLLGADYQQAVAPRDWAFPRDHGRHDGFRLEWWYFTGNLADDTGRRFGYQLTFFRSQLSPDAPQRQSPWATNNLYFAHAALADITGKSFFYRDITSRGREGLANASDTTLNVQLKDWSAILTDNTTALHAATPDFSLDLTCEMQAPVFQGPHGLSQKGPNPGQASYYYSMPSMATTGTLTLHGKSFHITGLSWMDHEFSSNLLADTQTGWDWISLQFFDGRALMIYRLRNIDGTDTRFGSLVDPNGHVKYLLPTDIQMTGDDPATAPSGAKYPQHWHLRIPNLPGTRPPHPPPQLRVADRRLHEGHLLRRPHRRPRSPQHPPRQRLSRNDRLRPRHRSQPTCHNLPRKMIHCPSVSPPACSAGFVVAASAGASAGYACGLFSHHVCSFLIAASSSPWFANAHVPCGRASRDSL